MRASSRKSSDQSSLRLYLLGSFRVERNAQAIHFPTRKIDSLLAYLVLHPEAHAREKLSTLLWGDTTDPHARHSLAVGLNLLRKKVGADLLIADRETVQLNSDAPIWVDASQFLQAATDDPLSAIALYQGDLLPDFYDEWVLQERERLHALYLSLLLGLAQDARSQSQYARAIEFAQKVLARDPANEKAYQHTIFCLAALGDRIGALKQFDECEKRLRDELGVEPAQETIVLRDQIERQLTGGKSREARLTNLPNPLTSFIGREKEIAEVKQLLAHYRLMTLIGSGGCGKSRLAIEVASQVIESFQKGVWWVDLAPLSDPLRVPQSVAQSLGVHETPNQSLDDTLINYLRGKPLLLILDNCEHLIAACANLADKLLRACPSLHILTTSREALGITGELIWRVPSLALPNAEVLLPIEQLMQYDAVRLFAERAKTITATWKLSAHALAVAHICRRLDGIPLAIELAAARLMVLSVAQIATRLDDRFNLLTSGSRTALPRQQTLRATMDWSYDLLSDAERTLLRRLSVFAGGWTLEAAESVCAGNGIEASNVLNLLTRLLDKSLILVEERGEVRDRMLETIRQYAHDKLLESGEDAVIRNRHLEYFLNFAETAEPRLRGRDQLEWLERLKIEHDNLRAALEWSAGEGRVNKGLRMAAALGRFWEMHGYGNEGHTRVQNLLNQPEAVAGTLERANALLVAARLTGLGGTGEIEQSRQYLEELVHIARDHGAEGRSVLALGLASWSDNVFGIDSTAGEAMVEEGLAIARSLDDEWLLGYLLFMRGWLFRGKNGKAAGKAFFEESQMHFKSLEDQYWVARLSLHIGGVHFGEGEFARARRELEQILPFFRQVKAKRDIAYVVNLLGEIARAEGKYDLAKKYYGEAFEISQDLGSQLGIALISLNLGFVALYEGESQSASSHFVDGFALGQEMKLNAAGYLMGFASLAAVEKESLKAVKLFAITDAQHEAGDKRNLTPTDQADYQHYLALAREQLDEATFNAAWEEGKKMTLEQAIKLALSQDTT